MNVTKAITLDFSMESRAVVRAKQGDSASRFVNITLTDNGVRYLPPDGASAHFRCVKKDHHSCYNSAQINDDGTVTVELTEQVLAVAGTVEADICLVLDGKVLSAATFQIEVEAVPIGYAVPSSSELLVLMDLIARAERIVTDVDEMITRNEELLADLTDEQKGVDAMREQIINLTEQCASLRSDLTNHGQIQLNLQKEMNSHREVIDEILAEQEAIDQRIADLEYVPVDITSVSNNVGTVELGATIETVTLSWKVNKTPDSLTVNGEAVDAAATAVTLEEQGLTADTVFTVKAVDERGASDEASTRIAFLNGVYYGVVKQGTELDSAAVLGLTRKLRGDRVMTFSASPAAGQQIAYAIPSRYGTPKFNVGGFDGGFYLAATLEFTNASGYKESYDVWLSDETGLGATSVAVS